MILNVAFYTVKDKKNNIRIALSCMVAALLSLAYPLLNITGILMFVLKLFVGFIIVAIAYKGKTFKSFMFFYITFMFLTAIYGGINIMLYFSLYGSFETTKTMSTTLILFSIFTITYLLKQVIKTLYDKKKIQQFVFDVEIADNNKRVKVKGYLDSGNVLCDPETKIPIVVISHRTFLKLYKNYPIQNLLTKNITNLKNAHYINVSTAVKNGEMLVFGVDWLIIKMANANKKISTPLLGLCSSKINLCNCEILLNPMLIL